MRRDSFDRDVRIVKEQHGNSQFTRIIDKETGEVINQFWDNRTSKPIGRPPGGGRKHHFFRVYCSNWADIIDHKRLSFIEVGVLMSLMRFVDWESNFLVHPVTGKNLNASELARLLKRVTHTCRHTLTDYTKRGCCLL